MFSSELSDSSLTAVNTNSKLSFVRNKMFKDQEDYLQETCLPIYCLHLYGGRKVLHKSNDLQSLNREEFRPSF